MEGIREYLISVTAAAMLCGIVTGISGEKGSTTALLRLICGIFLALTVIRPLKGFNLSAEFRIPGDLLSDAGNATDAGVDYARQALARHITEQCEAYILEKGKSLGADIRVNIRLSDDPSPIPVSVEISGHLSPYARNQLRHILETDLGIPEEDQHWIP